MPRITKIYTRKGDDGLTALGTGARVEKDALRVQAYGDVDELNSVLGLALAAGVCPELTTEIARLQHELFNLGSQLAFPPSKGSKPLVPVIEARHVEQLEKMIDRLNEQVGPLENFILPGGSIGAAQLQVARAICRRAERSIVSLSQEEAVGDIILPYINRLSDALFVMARFENKAKGVQEPLWNTSA